MTYRCTFERIGRGARGLVREYDADGPNDLAEKVYRDAKNHLASKSFEVTVNLEDGRGWFDGGRFGSFAIEEVSA
jgi:hypothetical protein